MADWHGAVWCAPTPELSPWRSRELAEPALELAVVDVGGCARLASGRLGCWGAALTSDQGAGPESLGGVAQVAAYFERVCALTRSDQLHCWGETCDATRSHRRSDGVTVIQRNEVRWEHRVRELPGAQQITGGCLPCAVTGEHRLECWFPTNPEGIALEIEREDVRHVAVGAGYQCVIDVHGASSCGSRDPQFPDDPYAWGWNLEGPVRAMVTASPPRTLCAIREGAAWCLGARIDEVDPAFESTRELRRLDLDVPPGLQLLLIGGGACVVDSTGSAACTAELTERLRPRWEAERLSED